MGSFSTDRIKEYQRRYQFWSERAVGQFSFSNNLLLTISIATLGYFYKQGKEEFENLAIWLPCKNSFDLGSTLFSLGTIFTGASVIFGLVVTLARLYDFRLTRHITLIRKRVYIDHVKAFPNKTPTDKKSLRSLLDLMIIPFTYRNIKIAHTECQKFDDNLKSKFLNIRALANGFGNLSWVAFNFQFILFLLGIFSYLFFFLYRILY